MAAVTLARVVVGGSGLGINPARVLPELAAVVPMESNLRKQTCYLAGLTFRELNPNPLPDNLGHAAKEGCFPLKQVQDFRRGQLAVLLSFRKINSRQLALPAF